MALKENITRLMAERGWKPVQLASALTDIGLYTSVPSVTNWINGINQPRPDAIVAIAQVFGVTPNDLLLDTRPAAATSEV